MAQPEFEAVDHFTHALTEPWESDLLPHGIDARKARMNAVVDEVVARLTLTPGMDRAQMALNVKLANGQV